LADHTSESASDTPEHVKNFIFTGKGEFSILMPSVLPLSVSAPKPKT